MLAYRFANEAQKEVHIATLRHLFVEFHDDQVARTALTNAIAMAEATLVSGQLDEWIERTNRWYRRTTRWLSVFFVALGVAELAFAWVQWRAGGLIPALGPIFFGLAVLTYCWALQGMWRIQRGYHDTLKRLEGMQLELPQVPRSALIAVQ